MKSVRQAEQMNMRFKIRYQETSCIGFLRNIQYFSKSVQKLQNAENQAANHTAFPFSLRTICYLDALILEAAKKFLQKQCENSKIGKLSIQMIIDLYFFRRFQI